MFVKGKRPQSGKESGIPPAQSTQAAQSNSYKKDAVLDEVNRVCRNEESGTPGPNTYGDHVKSVAKANGERVLAMPITNDRYAVLQRKLEDLERIHNEGKKSHRAEVERLKTELARNQKSKVELTERLERQAKQGTALEHRLEELKRESLADKAEIKELASKLRRSENQRTEVMAKQEDISEVRRTLRTAETRRKEEAREKDKKVAELEKILASEIKKSESQLKTKDQEIKTQGESIQLLKVEVMHARDEFEQLQQQYRDCQADSSVKVSSLLNELENHRIVLENVTQMYGKLASTTISKPLYDDLKHRHSTLQIQHLRTQRKLMNSECQVSELARLIIQVNDDHRFLNGCLREAEAEIRICQENATKYIPEQHLAASLSGLQKRIEDDLDLLLPVKLEIAEQETSLFDIAQKQTLLAYSSAMEELLVVRTLVHVQENELWGAEAAKQAVELQLKEVWEQRGLAEGLLQTATNTTNDLRVSLDIFKRQLSELEAKLEEEKRQATVAHDSVQKLSLLVQKGKMAEDGLRAEVEVLTTELIEAEKYQEAYYGLCDHLEALSARNALAEEEAQKLSAFNAEIIGHRNPAQRIMYVERIRNELAETQHKLLASTKSHEAVVALNNDLQQELDGYKSVILENRPKTTFTRVGRPPLVDFN
ncbi:hypothetical protein E1B28_009899 [Marasmius oreades]|uniref:Uncharacterized protein n=1 Tax=Marasmius oreades TaxID=181124 RepID=A0A9P7UR84_9AGAR|nr:uncharacterized protein E1B28_009899 [Marasmius oreades]KAG7090815.1 hypothetical protein E1B28_009899 [Marasmius oreades]